MAVERSQAEELLAAADAARRRARSALAAHWFPMILFGAVALASVLLFELWSWMAMAALWVVGAPLASIATGLWYSKRSQQVGVGSNPWPYVAVAIALIVGCIALGWGGHGGPISYAGPLFLIGLAYLIFARLYRSRAVAVLAAAMVIAAVVVYAVRPAHAYALTIGPFGAGSVLLGLWNLLQGKRAR